jgi:tRNA pseudouridine38-40 synthase
MSIWKLTLAYDGTPYHGWQVQPGLATVQGTLADAIYRVVHERVLPQGSGRTDAGVHALGQVASFALASQIPPPNLHRALNRCLPPSIRVLGCEVADEGFHARHRARAKTYLYRIFPLYDRPYVRQRRVTSEEQNVALCGDRERICPPMLAPFCWPCPWALELGALERAAAQIVGTHDFTSFAASDPRGSNPVVTPVRTIFESGWCVEGEFLLYRVRGTGFLHHMVRNLVGTFVLAGAGRLDVGTIPAMLNAHTRSATGPTAPASGLFLAHVEYPSAGEFEEPDYGDGHGDDE